MNYELAKKLKGVGFPQGGDGRFSNENGMPIPMFQPEVGEFGNFVYIPTLSELIETCGDKQIVIWRFKRKWYAGIYKYGSDIYIDDYPSYDAEGETPEEAVANLWLELNKKD